MIRELAKFRVYLDKLELCPKNLLKTNSFGEYKRYDMNGELVESCVYENGELK